MKGRGYEVNMRTRDVGGYAVVWGSVVRKEGKPPTLFERGAFSAAVRTPRDVEVRLEHFPENVGEILSLKEDDVGLFVRARLNGTGRGLVALESLSRCEIEGFSVGWNPVKATTDRDGVRRVKEATLMEVSLCSYPGERNSRVFFEGSSWGPPLEKVCRAVIEEARDLRRRARAADYSPEGISHQLAELEEGFASLKPPSLRDFLRGSA